MAWPVYSELLGTGQSVSGSFAVGGPDLSHVWVVNQALLTLGVDLLNPAAALGLSAAGPWFWILTLPNSKLLSLGQNTMAWAGRFVVPPGETLFMALTSGLTGDYYLSGFVLGPPVQGA